MYPTVTYLEVIPIVLHYLIKYLSSYNYLLFTLLILSITFETLLSFKIIIVYLIIQDIAVYFVCSHRVNGIVKHFHSNNKVTPIVNNKAANLALICHSKQNK